MKNRFYDINSKETVRLTAEENAPGDEQAMIEQIAAIYRRIHEAAALNRDAASSR